MTYSILHRRALRLAAPAFLFALACSAAWAYPAKVVRVESGDTIVISAAGKQSRLRLSEIDAPEPGQAYAGEAQRALSALCLGQNVEVTPMDDPYGSKVARVECDGRDAGEAQVASGMAWVFREFSQGPARLYSLEQDAQAAKRGLWADQAPTPPWEWRGGSKSAG